MQCELMMLRDPGCKPFNVCFFPLTENYIHSSAKSHKMGPSVRNHLVPKIKSHPPKGMEKMLAQVIISNRDKKIVTLSFAR